QNHITFAGDLFSFISYTFGCPYKCCGILGPAFINSIPTFTHFGGGENQLSETIVHFEIIQIFHAKQNGADHIIIAIPIWRKRSWYIHIRMNAVNGNTNTVAPHASVLVGAYYGINDIV